jgi:hypothetical protein
MKNNIEDLTRFNKFSLGDQLNNGVRNIRLTLDELEHKINVEENKAMLICFNNLYKIWVDRFYKKYGFKFPKVQEQYDELVPKINEYLEKEEKNDE